MASCMIAKGRYLWDMMTGSRSRGWNADWERVSEGIIKEKVPKYFGTLIFSA